MKPFGGKGIPPSEVSSLGPEREGVERIPLGGFPPFFFFSLLCRDTYFQKENDGLHKGDYVSVRLTESLYSPPFRNPVLRYTHKWRDGDTELS